MKVGIMQPYFVPYIGYWQLMNAVDKYVIYDDVNFIKQGWINRNRILADGQPRYFNIPMQGASSNKRINQVGVNNDTRLIEKNLRIIEDTYKKAPYYKEVYPMVQRILHCGGRNLAEYNEMSFSIICSYLGIKTELIVSSTLEKDCGLKGQDKVLAICGLLGATEYYNAIGGGCLYSDSAFREKGIELKFLRTDEITYRQFGGQFQKNLSIIDVMMFNSAEEIRRMLGKYTLLSADQTPGQGSDAEDAVGYGQA